MATAASLDTKEQILNVAEQAIAEHGYAGTTLRSVVSKAQVNLAAVHYHFGSKEALFQAVVARIAEPMVAQQITLLAAVMTETDGSPSVEAILRAYLAPAFKIVAHDQKARPARAQFIGRCRTEPEPVQSIADQQFRRGTEKFLDAFQRALPEQSRSQLKWKLDLVVTGLVRVLGEAGKPGALLTGTAAEDIEGALAKLIAFVIPGLKASG